jgi:hypothetical protein
MDSMSTTLEIMAPTKELPDWLKLVAPRVDNEPISGRPDDELQRQAEGIGRSNVSYEHVWNAVREAKGAWVPVRCNSLRRALLLASSAVQHRTQAHDVRRRGRIVCIRLMGQAESAA